MNLGFYRAGVVPLLVAWTMGMGWTGSAVAVGRPLLSAQVPPAVAHVQPTGRLPAAQQLRLAIGLPLRNREALTNLLEQLYTPGHANYHRYLQPEEFAAQFGPTEQDYQAVIAFARTNGLRVTTTHPNRVLLDVMGSVGDIERAFHTTLRLYPHPKEGRSFYAPDVEPTADVGVPILHVAGLDNFILPRPNVKPASQGALPRPVPAVGSGPNGAYCGNDFRAAYARGVALTGAGQHVGLLQFDGYYTNDIASYLRQTGLPSVLLENVWLNDFDGTPGSGNVEVALDIETTISMAPGLSSVIIYSVGSNGSGDDILNRMATDNLARQLSASWTFSVTPTTTQIFQQFMAQGQSYFNASGDDGAYAGAVSAPADNPYVTVVGGTTLSTSSAGGPWSSETTWNWYSSGQGQGASAGGSSTSFTIPGWQQGMDFSNNQGSSTHRNIPDVAMIADEVWVVTDNGTSHAVGGTSCASPLWAAFTALVNQQAAAVGQPPVGFLNPALYAIGASPGYATNFHDITTGNNKSPTVSDRFSAVAGYDLCTGWGSPIGLNLIKTLVPQANVPLITNAGVTLISEGCFPGNGFVDPGETVTVNVALKNVAAVKTTNLVATLQADNGVLSPSGPQVYGILNGGGNAVNRSFSFTANGACGGVLAATVQLSDGESSLGSVGLNFVLGKPTIVLTQGFDTVTPPALPGGWTRTVSGAASNWITSAVLRDSGPNAATIVGPPDPGIGELISPMILISTPNAQLSFRNYFNIEADLADPAKAYDGGVLEISIGSGAYADILAAGGSFVTGGYTRTVDSTGDNMLGARQVWSGLSGGFIPTVVNLPGSAAGHSVRLKWRFGTDSGNFGGASTWCIDTISLQDGAACCSSTADLAVALTPPPDPGVLGGDLSYTITYTNAGPQTAYGVTIIDSMPTNVAFVSASAGGVYTNGGVRWSFGALPSGAAGSLALAVTPISGDSVSNFVAIGSYTSDPGLGDNTANTVTALLPASAPLISAQPVDVIVATGSNATLQVAADGAPAPVYQWFFNDAILLAGTASTLVITNVQPEQAGVYHVVVTNVAGVVTSSVARVTVLVPPVFVSSNLTVAGNQFGLTLNSVAGLTYALEYKDALSDPAWTPLPPAVPGTGTPITLQDTNPPVLPSRFYRVNAYPSP